MKDHLILCIIGIIVLIVLLKLLERILMGKWNISRIDRATGTEFEQYLYYIFQSQGYRVRHTGKSGDYGADLILYKGKEKIVVQAKRYRGSVGQEAVREAVAACGYYHADRAMVVTNSKFTDAAVKLAKSNHVTLLDREWVKKMTTKEFLLKKNKTTEESEYSIGILYKRHLRGTGEVPDEAEIAQRLDEFLADCGYHVSKE